MKFRDTYLPNDLESSENLRINKNTSDIGGFRLELDFVEQYWDDDGILHIKTCFDHSAMDPDDLWEVFETNDCSNPLELLLPNYD